MPLVKVNMIKGKSSEYKKAVLDCIHDGLIESIGIEDWDRFQRIVEIPRDFLKRRFSKVYWPYAIAVVGWVLWYWALGDGILWKEGISHLLLYKMFVPDLDVSLCYPYWFISCILQFYLCWPLIVRTARMGGGKLNRYGIATCMLISLTWTTAVGLLGYQDFRPWGSCFLQYLWEFVLGMWLAEKYFECSDNEKWFQIENIQWKWILIGAICGMCLSGFMGLKGGILKLYNDIPSLIGYLSCLLIVYKLGIKQINKFFVWASSFGYELYLVHSLTFVVLHTIIGGKLPLLMELLFCFVGAYVVASVIEFFYFMAYADDSADRLYRNH